MIQSKHFSIFLATVGLFISFSTSAQKLNQTQIIGSHNSYKSAMPEEILAYLRGINPKSAESLSYAHESLENQLNRGLRNLELDVYHDPEGGKYSQPKGLDIIKNAGGQTDTYDPENKLAVPGLKLFHVQDIDFMSHYLLFADALRALRNWSTAHPDHHPIFVLINAKDAAIPSTRKPLPFTAAALDSIDLEIKTFLGMNKLITPDEVKGNFASLEQAVLNNNWPNLEDSRGKFLFVLDESEEKIRRYLTLKPGLEKAALFVNLKEGNPEAAFRIINDPVKNQDNIQELVKKGYLVRTRADSDTQSARNEDYSQFEKAQSSGAQILSTDYYLPSRFFPSTYQVAFKNGRYEQTNPLFPQFKK